MNWNLIVSTDTACSSNGIACTLLWSFLFASSATTTLPLNHLLLNAVPCHIAFYVDAFREFKEVNLLRQALQINSDMQQKHTEYAWHRPYVQSAVFLSPLFSKHAGNTPLRASNWRVLHIFWILLKSTTCVVLVDGIHTMHPFIYLLFLASICNVSSRIKVSIRTLISLLETLVGRCIRKLG